MIIDSPGLRKFWASRKPAYVTLVTFARTTLRIKPYAMITPLLRTRSSDGFGRIPAGPTPGFPVLTIGIATVLAFNSMWIAPVNAGDLNRGNEIYRRECAQCHGSNGRPAVPDAPDFSRGESLIAGDSALLRKIQRGNRAMPGFENILSEQEILSVITYLRTLF